VLKGKKDNFAKEEVLLPEEEKNKRGAEIKKLEQDAIQMQTTRFGVSGDYFQKRQELIKPIQDKVFDAMQKVAQKKGYSFVFDKANQSNLVYAENKFDLSNDVLKEMGITVK
jgi:outer membrane protein